MRIIRDLNNKITREKIVITIGNFDGIHIGHQGLIEEAVKIAKENKSKSVVLSFEPHPSVFFNRIDKNYRIISLKNKIITLEKMGVNIFVIARFNQKLATMPTKDFLNYLSKIYDIQTIVVGHDFNCGYNRDGNISMLFDLAKKYNFNISQILERKNNDITHSSSNIRKLIQMGEVDKVAQHLGHYHYITGRVIKGKMMARTLGFPTANIKLHQLLKPKYGVYYVRILLDNILYQGMANIGIRPTLGTKDELLEVNIFDYNGNIYGKKITIELIKFIREEQKFPNLVALQQQIQQDSIVIKELINEIKVI